MSLTAIPLPDLGEGVTEGEIVKIKVKEGEQIAMDQILLEVMTDKASMEVPSSIEGLVKKVAVQEGDIVSVGTDLFLIETSPSNKETVPLNEKESFKIKSQAEKELPSKNTSLKEQLSKEDVSSKELLQKQSSWSELTKTALEETSSSKKPASIPATRKLAQELGIDLKKVFKNQAKVERKDLLNYIKRELEDSYEKAPSKKNPAVFQELPSFNEKKRVPLRGVQRLMFESMTFSKTTIPHFTLGESAQIDHLIGLRTEMKNRMEKQGLKVGFLPFFIKALIPVIEEFPLFNAVYASQSKEIVFKEDLNVGFAVDSPQGLMVPVIKQVQNKSLLEVIKEVYEKANQARGGAIPRENLKGASLTLTNLGGIGGMYGTPIIPPFEMAILGIYKIYPKVVKKKTGGYEEKNFINFSITCDHRFIDGAAAVRFLKSFIEKIEEPSLLLL